MEHEEKGKKKEHEGLSVFKGEGKRRNQREKDYRIVK